MNKTTATLEGFLTLLKAKSFNGLLTITVSEPYIGSITPVTVLCETHGSCSTLTGYLMKSKHGCRGCATDAQRKLVKGRISGKYKVSESDFWEYVEAHGFKSRFKIELAPYRGVMTPVTLTCTEHGAHITIAGDVMRTKHGCPKCAQVATGISITKLLTGVPLKAKWKPVETFIAKLKIPESISVNVSEYQSMNLGSVKTVCKTHGENIWAPPSALTFSTYGCRDCAADARIKSKSNDWSQFLSRAKANFGERFEYQDNFEYINLRSYVDIICSIHGAQKISASKHVVNGQYCAVCRMNDLRVSGKLPGYVGDALISNPEFGKTPARIYYIKVGKLYKIGITWAKDKNSRIRGLRNESKKEVTVLETVEFTLAEAYKWEQLILAEFSEHRVTRSWSTELFDRDVLQVHGGLEKFIETGENNESNCS